MLKWIYYKLFVNNISFGTFVCFHDKLVDYNLFVDYLDYDLYNVV